MTYTWQTYFSTEPCDGGWDIGQDYLAKADGDFAKAIQLMPPVRRGYCLWAIENTILSQSLADLATDDNWEVRRSVAQNVDTPCKTLQQLATDDNWAVRWGVAQNVNAPAESLQQLATDEDVYIRRSVAKNVNTPAEALQQLATDDDWRVRGAVAQNANTPVETLNMLGGE
jgi:hypothetical protein